MAAIVFTDTEFKFAVPPLVTVALKASDIERAYSGRKGCACGCKGTYTDKPGGIKSRLKNAMALTADDSDSEITEVVSCPTYLYIGYTTLCGVERCYCFYRKEAK